MTVTAPTLAQRIGAAVRAARVEAGLSQYELARTLGVSQPRVSHIEAGRSEPRVSQLETVEDALGLDRGAILARLYAETPR